MSAPLIHAHMLRIDEDSAAAVDGVSFTTAGRRVFVLGAARALFEACAGLRPTTGGELHVEGMAPSAAARRRLSAAAPLDPPLPATYSVETYVRWSARLAGHGPGDARSLAAEALEALRLTPLRASPLGKASPLARRATVVAAALATGAPCLLLEDPLSELAGTPRTSFEETLVRTVSTRSFVVFAPRAPLSSALTQASDEAVVFAGSQVVGQGSAKDLALQSGAYAVSVMGNLREFTSALRARGATVHGGGHAFSVALGDELTARDLLTLALRNEAIVVDMRPIAYAFE